MSFKLLAIRPLKGCLDNIRKNLKEDEFYFFDNSYERYKNSDYIVKKEDITDLPNDFFLQKNTESSLEYINVQAIVGMNGSGKSAIAELLLGTLNNTFKYISEEIKNDIDLSFLRGLKAALYFELDNVIYVITVTDKELEIEQNLENLVLDKKTTEIQDIKIIYKILNDETSNNKISKLVFNNLSKEVVNNIKNIFFTMYINYSLYGLDDQDFAQKKSEQYEGDKVKSELQLDGSERLVYVSWLTKIFHKNDGYQTPLVIHPYRQNAMINVRNEKHLMENRLSALLFTNPEYRTIIPGYEFDTICFYLKDSFARYIIKILKKQENKEGSIILGVSKTEKIENVSVFVDNMYQWVLDNNDLIKKVHDINKNDKILFSKEHEMKRLLLAMQAYLFDSKLVVKELKKRTKGRVNINVDDDFEYILTVFMFNPITINIDAFLSSLNIKIDDKINMLLAKLRAFSFETMSVLTQLSSSRGAFIETFRIKKEQTFCDNDKRGSTNWRLRRRLLEYCIVKSVKITRYSNYYESGDLFDLSNFFGNKNKEIEVKYREYVTTVLNEDKSHITEKLRRTALLLSFMEKPIMNDEQRTTKELIDYYFNLVNSSVPYTFVEGVNKELIKDINDLGKLINIIKDIDKERIIELTDLLPPPIFDYEFYSKEDNVSFSKVSSGQFQKIGLLSSIVYHLKNLDSVRETEDIYSYENVNLILDEIELYFHPEQQRTFVNELLGLLRENKFKQIKRINIMFITHSPFILSDIPSQNVLKLKDGKPEEGDSINSFGANIHDLLADEFFLDKGFMGEFAKEKINGVIKFLYLKKSIIELDSNMSNTFFSETMQETFKEAKEKLSKELEGLEVKYSKEEVEQHIKLIGEPLLAVKIKEMYEIAFKEN
ncbi:AAA family ATPase [Myroides odoratimimus]|uniref:AAA family ATPase n=1 Tax=Myroides odoratimimus TaxID=76832 RepID=UPI001CE082BC|nr:AAA family ATPase [Myroides odoratimimus]MCA4806869.1 ATP-binding protein [Myroides odoratimimus]MDM1530347.1 ATP-binding protein [Myroides odoratimimus]